MAPATHCGRDLKETPISLRQSSALRFGLLISAVFLIANALAFATAYLNSRQELSDIAEQRVLDEVASFVEIYHADGSGRLFEQIGIHAVTATSGDELFYFAGRTESQSVGNVVIRERFEGWRRLTGSELAPQSGVDVADEYLAFGTLLDGQPLIIAQSTEPLDELNEIFMRSFLIALVASTLIALATTALFVWRAETRIGAIARTLDAVAGGRYAARVPDGGARSDDLARISRSINGMLGRLEGNIAGLKQISADIAHDLKTPLQRLRTTLEPLGSAGLDPDAASQIGADAVNQAETIVRTFQALLRIAQIEGGSPKARFQAVDLHETCESVAEVFQPALEDAGHSFTLTATGSETVLVDGDRDLIAQMLSNLIENAIRHAPPPAAIGLTLSRHGAEVVIEVSDTGPGIPADERERVFRRLYRLERSRTSEGSGLGLALVAAVVDLHGGSVKLEDNAPGLRVVVRLPVLAGPATQS